MAMVDQGDSIYDIVLMGFPQRNARRTETEFAKLPFFVDIRHRRERGVKKTQQWLKFRVWGLKKTDQMKNLSVKFVNTFDNQKTNLYQNISAH